MYCCIFLVGYCYVFGTYLFAIATYLLGICLRRCAISGTSWSSYLGGSRPIVEPFFGPPFPLDLICWWKKYRQEAPVWVEFCWFFARSKNNVGVFVFSEATEQSNRHPFFVGGLPVDLEDWAIVRCCPLYCFFPLGRIFHICCGGVHVDAKDSPCRSVATPRDEDVPLRSVCEDKVSGEVLPLLAGQLDHEEAFFVFEGNTIQDFLDASGSLFL